MNGSEKEKLENLNEFGVSELEEILRKCCSSEKWINKMLLSKPYTSKEELFKIAGNSWYSLQESDWREAFSSHPKIGDLNSLKEKFIATKTLAENEQSGVNNAPLRTLSELAKYNEEYEKKFGYIFIVCASGKSADELLSIIKIRMNNNPEDEIKIAMEEQFKITKLRLEKLI